MASYAKLRTDLVSARAEIDGQTVFNIKDPVTGNYFRLREPEFWLINQLDGSTSYEEIAERFREKFNLEIGVDNVRKFVTVLEQKYFLEDQRAEQVVSRKSFGYEERESLFSRLLFVKLKAVNPTRFLDFLVKIYRPFHSPAGFAAEILLILFGIGVLLANSTYFAVRLSEVFNIGSIVTIVVAFFILVTLHEVAHGLICRYYGGEVRELGFLLMYFQPCFYCDVSDAWLFDKKSQRLAVTFAGPFFSFVLMAIAVIVWRVTVPGTFVNEVARLIGIVNWVTQLFNFNPLIKLDGYYLLSDWLEIPNLRRKSFEYFGNAFKRRVLGWPLEAPNLPKRERTIFLIYAASAIIYSAMLLSYLFWLLAGFLHAKMGGVGLILLLAILFFTLRASITRLARGAVQHVKYMKQLLKKPARLVTYIVLILVAVIFLFVIRFPYRVTGDVTVRPVAEFSLLINDFGLLEKRFRRGGENSENKSSYLQMTSTDMASLDLVPFVKDGQHVNKGDTLAVLISNQVSTELAAAQSTLEKLEMDLALLRSPPKKERVAEAEAEVAAARAVYDQKLRDEKRLAGLWEKEGTTKEALESAQAAVAVAKAEVENKEAKVRLLKSPPKPEEEAVILSEIAKQRANIQFLQTQMDNQSILAPISGMVIINQLDDCVLSIVENDQVEVMIPVSDFNINLVQSGQKVKLKVRSFTDRVFEGRVAHIPKNAARVEGGSRFFVSTVIDNQGKLLHKGMTGYAKIEVGRRSLFSMMMRKLASIVRVEFWSWW